MKTNTINILNRIFGTGVFSKDEVNTGRQIELDIAKGFAILFIVWVHTAETFSAGTGLGYEIVDNFLGGPFAAPVFGYLVAKVLRYLEDKKTFYLKASIAGGVLGFGYLILAYVFKFSFGMYGENGYYYFLGPIDTIAVLLLVVGIFGFD